MENTYGESFLVFVTENGAHLNFRTSKFFFFFHSQKVLEFTFTKKLGLGNSVNQKSPQLLMKDETIEDIVCGGQENR